MMPCMELIRKIDMLQPEIKEVLYSFIEEIEKDHEVKRSEFIEPAITDIKIDLNDLKNLVIELSESHKETEERLQKLIKDFENTGKQIGGLNKDMTLNQKDVSYKLPSLRKSGYFCSSFPGSKGLCHI